MDKHCILCDPDGSDETHWIDEHGKKQWVWVGEYGMVLHKDDYHAVGYIPILYCPYCGRRLKTDESKVHA